MENPVELRVQKAKAALDSSTLVGITKLTLSRGLESRFVAVSELSETEKIAGINEEMRLRGFYWDETTQQYNNVVLQPRRFFSRNQ